MCGRSRIGRGRRGSPGRRERGSRGSCHQVESHEASGAARTADDECRAIVDTAGIAAHADGAVPVAEYTARADTASPDRRAFASTTCRCACRGGGCAKAARGRPGPVPHADACHPSGGGAPRLRRGRPPCQTTGRGRRGDQIRSRGGIGRRDGTPEPAGSGMWRPAGVLPQARWPQPLGGGDGDGPAANLRRGTCRGKASRELARREPRWFAQRCARLAAILVERRRALRAAGDGVLVPHAARPRLRPKPCEIRHRGASRRG
mmetsp:Transcript_36357/g.92894  ORF Transcript_36357/g.92894 Transcript_36357/m.92894 type:complete len:262 (-) Transcript_36357:642-1427(-)